MKCGRILASSFSRNERRLAARQCENVEMWKCGVENWEAGVAFVTPQAAKTRGAVLCSGVNKRARSWHKARRTGGQWLEQWNRKDSGQDEDVDEDAETGGHDDSRSCIGSRWTALIEPCYVDSNAFQCVAKQRVDPITYCHRFPASRLSLLAGKSSNCRKSEPESALCTTTPSRVCSKSAALPRQRIEGSELSCKALDEGADPWKMCLWNGWTFWNKL